MARDPKTSPLKAFGAPPSLEDTRDNLNEASSRVMAAVLAQVEPTKYMSFRVPASLAKDVKRAALEADMDIQDWLIEAVKTKLGQL